MRRESLLYYRVLERCVYYSYCSYYHHHTLDSLCPYCFSSSSTPPATLFRSVPCSRTRFPPRSFFLDRYSPLHLPVHCASYAVLCQCMASVMLSRLRNIPPAASMILLWQPEQSRILSIWLIRNSDVATTILNTYLRTATLLSNTEHSLQ